MTRRVRDESGFTLVELVLAVTVMGMIMVTMGAAFSTTVRTMNVASNRLSDSNDAQRMGVYFPRDVQSASTVITSSFTCSGLADSGTIKQVMQLSDSTFNVVYAVRSVASGSSTVYQLERRDCTGGTLQSGTTVVARNLLSATAAVGARIPTSGTLTGASVTITGKTSTTDTSSYVFTVTGQRRST